MIFPDSYVAYEYHDILFNSVVTFMNFYPDFGFINAHINTSEVHLKVVMSIKWGSGNIIMLQDISQTEIHMIVTFINHIQVN